MGEGSDKKCKLIKWAWLAAMSMSMSMPATFDGFAVSRQLQQLLQKHQSKHNLIKTFKPKT